MAQVPRVLVPQIVSASKFFPSLDFVSLSAFCLFVCFCHWVGVMPGFIYYLVPVHNHTNRVSMMIFWISKYHYQFRYLVQKLSQSVFGYFLLLPR